MKIKLLTSFLLTVLIFSASAKFINAQTGADAASKPDAMHTLSEAQKQTIKRIKVESEKKAAPTALIFAGIVSRIYENMLADKPDEALRLKLDAEMKEETWKLLAIKGQSIRDIVGVLTPEQKQLVKSEMRKPDTPADLSEVIARTFKLDEK
jgi:Spy/CpxP family protein refolding chaperone